ncbi:AMP-binding protein [Noviherbaspirillum saxi]|uniref:ATP-dependent acyl-CoA ligase n=1 Tax=Noviherbaspirillum saxi TaxID=2320863 RepID=A0A3A3FJZ2_9BURK|nr:AMP-binding protein [Noviherbaspirillum saxi]RJF91655.1 ATP-dependent acyl-CoA ligase [Noviherbaspirillum saxi]
MKTENSKPWSMGHQDTVNAVLRRAAEKHGERTFLDFLGDEYSFTEVNRRACRLAHGLSALGVAKGDTVVTVLDNSADAVFIWLAINKLGAVSVPVNTALKGEFLRHQVGDAGATVIIAEHDYAERVAAIAERLPEFRTLVYRGPQPAINGLRQDLLPWATLLSDNTSEPDVEIKPSDLAMLIYTGGTTGPSKGCMISHNYVCTMAHQMVRLTGRTEEAITWTPLPLFHFNAIGSTVLCNLIVGARVALYTRFSVSNFWPEIERTEATDVALLAAMFPMLAKAPDNDAMKCCHGQLFAAWGAPFPPDIQAIWKERFGLKYTVAGGFGLSECSLLTLLPFGTEAKPGSSGLRNEWFDVRIVDENDLELPPNTPGEIIVRPRMPHIMFEGYWRRPDDTLKVMKNLWFHTGDIGKFDEDDYFYFVDRKKDYLRRRGENISSFEVENAFRAHEAIEDVAAHAVLDPMGEDELKVTIVLKAGAQLSEESLCNWSIDQLPYYAVPRYIELRSDFPRSPVGRILKYELRDQGVTPMTWDREKSGIVLKKR